MAVKNVTIYDIAEEADVSPATVSRVLTGSANVRQDKKKRVEELIQKYNFKPSAVARSLTDTRRKLIGIIAADVRNVFYADVYVACEIAADQLGYTVLLLNSFGIREMEKKQLDKLVEQRVDAVIHLGGAADDVVSNMDYVEHVRNVTGTIPVVTTGKLDGTAVYMVQIQISVCDMEGNLQTEAQIPLELQVEGEAEFLHMDNGNLADTTSYTSHDRQTWGGHLMLYIRSTEQAGKVIITAKSKQIESKKIESKQIERLQLQFATIQNDLCNRAE